MLKNYLRTAFRNLLTNKLHSLINMTGLALGMAAATLLLLDIQYGLSIDQFHKKKASLCQVYNRGMLNGQITCYNTTAAPLGPALQNFPEIAHITRISGINNVFKTGEQLIPASGNFTDAAFLSMFSFPLRIGNPQTALQNPNSIVITDQLAKKLFGTQDPVNQIITTTSGDNFTVTGILEDLPANTQFNFEFLLPWSSRKTASSWKNLNCFTYAELTSDAKIEDLNRKIASLITHNNPAEPALAGQSPFLYPLSKVYLEGRFQNGKPAGGNIDNLKMLGGLAAIILLIACINFMNLSTARSEKRAREVGIRKVAGAARHSLVLQFIGESILMASLSAIIALVLVQFAIPAFADLIHVRLSIPWNAPSFWLAAVVFILFTGILAGSYPAFYLSSFKPIKVLKNALQNSNALVTPRKILVVVQFAFSIFLINFTLIYQKQIQYGLDRQIGFAKDDLVYHGLTPDLRRNYAACKNELLSSGIAASVSQASGTVTRVDLEESGLKWDGMDPKANPSFVLMMEDGGFVRTNGLSLLAGRDIDIEKYPGDTLSCVINEASVKVLGFKQPVGQIIYDEAERWKIVGVVKDFLAGDPSQSIEPLLVKGGAGAGYINIRMARNGSFQLHAREAEAILKKYNPSFITDLKFADADYAAKFRQTKDTALLIHSFTFIAIFVSCMGLLGLAIYMTENRTREIGIRKILGSGTVALVTLLTKDFVQLIVISILLASPTAWFFMHSFLQHFTYRTPLNAWILVLSGAAALVMALLTISFQVLRAARQNPVKNLRTD